MIEYYTLMHRGGRDDYLDNVYINHGEKLTAFLYYGSSDRTTEVRSNEAKLAGAVVSGGRGRPFDEIASDVAMYMGNESEYLLIRISNEEVMIDSRGGVYAMIAKKGDVRRLPNGLMKLDNGDRIVCGTTRFYKKLTKPAIYTDAMISFSSEEWMDFMVCRISEQTMLSEGNLTAITFIVRNDEIRIKE
ncbi:MAG: hypothetical protein IKN14_05455 [Clostridiales bacterium]|nr:hypothetical protein [Clostridiales bacterium]